MHHKTDSIIELFAHGMMRIRHMIWNSLRELCIASNVVQTIVDLMARRNCARRNCV